MSDPDKGATHGSIAPYDPSNYGNPGQFAGMDARRRADMEASRPAAPAHPAGGGGVTGGVVGTVAALVIGLAGGAGLFGDNASLNAVMSGLFLIIALVAAIATFVTYLMQR